jgi:hypothetical protein
MPRRSPPCLETVDEPVSGSREIRLQNWILERRLVDAEIGNVFRLRTIDRVLMRMSYQSAVSTSPDEARLQMTPTVQFRRFLAQSVLRCWSWIENDGLR